MPWASMLQSLVNQSIERSEHLQERLEELKSRRFTSSEAPLFLIELLSTFNSRISDRLIKITDTKLSTPLDYSRYIDLLNELKSNAGVISQLYMHLWYIEASRVETNPPGLVSAIERIAKTLMPNQMVLICPSYRCTYEYHNLLSQNNLRSEKYVPRIFAPDDFKEREHFAVLLYPFVIRDDVLCHTLLMHELAHFIDEFKRVCASELSKRPKETPPDVSDGDLYDHFIEYAADIMATYILGPAFLFALIEFHTSIAGPTDLLPSHPPLLFRINNILSSMDAYEQSFRSFSGKYEDAKKVQGFLDALSRETENKKLESIFSDDKKPYNIFKCLMPFFQNVRQSIKRIIPATVTFNPSERLFKLFLGWVKDGIPPSAYRDGNQVKTLTLAELLNATWIYRVNYLQEPTKLSSPLRKEEYTGRLRDLSRLAQLAIRQNESVHFHEEAGTV